MHDGYSQHSRAAGYGLAALVCLLGEVVPARGAKVVGAALGGQGLDFASGACVDHDDPP
jgi:hypothetical protein